MKLSRFLNVDAIEPDLSCAGPDEVLQVLVDRMVAAGHLPEPGDALECLRARERLKSTGIGGGIAIPHAKTRTVSRTWIALGRSRQGVPFQADDGQPVTVVFMILGPPDSSAEHVKVLSRIARLVRQPDFLSACAQAADADALLAAVIQYET